MYTDWAGMTELPAQEETVPQATSVSLAKFTASVQAAVKAAVAKHPKFQVEVPQSVSISFLIRGFPIPDGILATTTIGEAQAFADDVAANLASAHPEVLSGPGGAAQGAVISVARHVILGIPPIAQTFQLEK